MMCACLRCKLPNFPYKGMTNPNCTCTCVPASQVQVSLGYKFTNPYPNPNQTHELTPGYSLPMPFPSQKLVRIISNLPGFGTINEIIANYCHYLDSQF